ncbi:MAG: ATPase, T2SS/T4P/T4SS family, partial [bacterium]|nr:ATPase, T2SS/T4P/T4SS family [bacterium]
QAQTQSKIGLDFPELLRNVLRQSPDVIMVGEIRDSDTAETAIRAASSGHLVLATLHAPVASRAVNRMLGLGSNPYFLSSSLLGVIAQRLVRKLCPACRMGFDVTAAPEMFGGIRDMLAPGEGEALFGPTGCDECGGDGYLGRTGLFEVMTFTQAMRKLISRSAESEEIEEAAINAGMIEFRRSAMLLVAQGVTSMEEILRDVPAEHLGLED